MKKYAVLCLFIVLLPTLSLAEKVQIKIEYSYSADVFEVMDNVSAWWPGFIEDEYRNYWEKEFTVNSEDQKFFDQYQKMRQKYYNDPDQDEKNPLKNRNGFFSTASSLTADPYAEAFYSSNSMLEAFKKLDMVLSSDELTFIKNFYDHFKTKYETWISKDKSAFSTSIEKVRKVFHQSGIDLYFNRVAKFYKTTGDLTYRVLYTWWPPLKRTLANPTGKFLIMKYNPVLHKNKVDSDVVAHEIIHTLSARQSLEQKRVLTDAFLKECPLQEKLKKLVILEEPLAVVFGQMIFAEKFQKNQFTTTENFYNNAWINTFSRLLFVPLKTRFEKNEFLDQGFVGDAAVVCKDLIKAMEQIKP